MRQFRYAKEKPLSASFKWKGRSSRPSRGKMYSEIAKIYGKNKSSIC